MNSLLSIDARLRFPDFEFAVSVDVQLAGVTGLFGVSGSGKSTLLRIIAGLEPDASGKIVSGSETWLDSNNKVRVPAHRRPVGYVFQSARLFEHLSVRRNLAYAASRAGGDENAIAYDEIIQALDLQPLLHRTTQSLSGGERQRVALGRTLLTQPRLLLLDEPLAALDAGRKAEILPYLEELPRRFEIPTIYVSHAIDEVSRLADRVIVLHQGAVKVAGPVTEILNQLEIQSPVSRFDIVTILETRVCGHMPHIGLTRLDLHGQKVVVPLLENVMATDPVKLYVRAGDVAIATKKPEHLSIRNTLAGVVADIRPEAESPFALVTIGIGDTKLRAQLTRHAIEELGLKTGTMVFALLKTASFDQRQ